MVKLNFLSTKYLLTFICIFFLLTRLYKISEIPPSVYWDEASIGYNAYSVLKTGKDEWGEFLPIHFRAFGEFKLPVYIYSAIPFISIFDLNELSVRFPAVLFSLGVVILTYLLAKRLSEDEKVGLFASFFIVISPWFFIFSRTGYEATAGLMFYLLGILIFLQKINGMFFLLSVLSFILSAYSYNSFRIISPLTLLVLVLVNKDNVSQLMRKSTLWIIVSFTVSLLAVWPIWKLYVYDAGISRFQTIGELSTSAVVRNYLSHFDPYFLFIEGDNNLRHQQPNFGQLYLPELIPTIAGLIYVLRSKLRYRWLPVVLIFLAPIPAAITKESPHALRSLSIVPFIHIISAMGLLYLTQLFKRVILINLFVLAILLIFFVNYFINFINIYSIQASDYWQVGYKKIFKDPKLQLENSDKIYISEEAGQPYIFALFYLKYDPEKFRMEVVRNNVDKWGFSTVKKFGKFEFGDYK